MLFLHLLAAILSCWRLADLISGDAITLRFRQRFPLYILTCTRCLSVWTGIFATLLFIYFPFGNWPFALAWLYLIKEESKEPHVTLRVKGEDIKVFGNVPTETLVGIIHRSARALGLIKTEAEPAQ